MIYEFKGHKVSNSLAVFNYYKSVTGTSLDRDIRKMKQLNDVLQNPDATDDEVLTIQEKTDIDICTTVQLIYYSMRCAAEKKELDLGEVNDEIDISDLADGSLQELIMKLVEVKKKETAKAETLRFLKRKK